MRWWVILEKKSSTALSQEAEVGVKWKIQRRWRDSPPPTNGILHYCEAAGLFNSNESFRPVAAAPRQYDPDYARAIIRLRWVLRAQYSQRALV